MTAFRFSAEPLVPETLRRQLDDPACGGFVAFEGWVRDHNDGMAVTRLEYEAYEALAIVEGERIIAEARRLFPIRAAACCHRVGTLDIGELAVWVGVSAAHRDEAFRACRYLIDEIKSRVPIWKKEHYVDGNSGWVNCEQCVGHAHEVPDYSRQTVLPQVGADGQAKLASARVLVVGAGGLGCPVLAYLAAAGVGHLIVIDGDRLEASNLHRQVLYDAADLGQPKATLAAARLARMNPDVRVTAIAARLSAANASELMADADLVVDCSDDFATKLLINDAAMLAGKPAIFGSIYQLEGQLQVVEPAARTACMRCIWPDASCAAGALSCAEAGVLGPVPGVFGSLQAVEALKLLLDLPGRTSGSTLLIDLVTHRVSQIRAQRHRDCVQGSGCARIHALEGDGNDDDLALRFVSIDAARSAGYLIVDVRDPDEIRAQPVAGEPPLHMPMTALDATALPDRNARYLIVCASGRRSLAATRVLRAAGVSGAYSLDGGLHDH